MCTATNNSNPSDDNSSNNKSSSSSVVEIEGITLPNVKEVDGVELKRNGYGVRSINLFGWEIKVYVATFYTVKPILKSDDVYNDNINNNNNNTGPMQLDFTFLRSVGQFEVNAAWTKQIDYSITDREKQYDGYDKDRDEFISLMSDCNIECNGTQSVQMIGDDTIVIDQGIQKGKITGSNFQRAFKSMWFGEQAVAEDLKDGLLNKNNIGSSSHDLYNNDSLHQDGQDPAKAVVG